MTDYVQNLDASALLTVEAVSLLSFHIETFANLLIEGLSFAVAAFASPPYNFPLFLFGIYTQERSEPAESSKLFTSLLGVSAILDFIWMFRNDQNGFIKAISILILILKVSKTHFSPLYILSRPLRYLHFLPLNVVQALLDFREAKQVSWYASTVIQALRHVFLAVWSMPGGFSSGGAQGAYQALGDDLESGRPAARPQTTPPPPPASATTQPPPVSNPYQSL